MYSFRPLQVGFAAAIATFFLGFGTLNIFSLALKVGPNLRGLYSYWSASIGDSIVLPATVLFLVASLCCISWTRQIALIGGFAAIFGFAAGVAVQVSWLSDPSPQLNWTLVAPGDFNAAGWYHAAFLCLMCAFVSGSLGGVLGAAHERALPRNTRAWFSWGVVGLFSFAVLLVLDNLRQMTFANIATLVGLGVGAAGAISVAVVAGLRRG